MFCYKADWFFFWPVYGLNNGKGGESLLIDTINLAVWLCGMAVRVLEPV